MIDPRDVGGHPMRPVYPRTQYNTQYTSTPRVNAGDIPQSSSTKAMSSLSEDECVGYPPDVFEDSYASRIGYGMYFYFTSSQNNRDADYIKPQPNLSPYKKPTPPITAGPIKSRSPLPLITSKAPDVTLKAGKTGKEDNGMEKSLSTEELTAEMANLEGLMKDLNAITQQEFEC
ncbi:uncharacterized protein [Haliotis asinina]